MFLLAKSSVEAKEKMKSEKRVALYVRVSTTNTRQSPEMQTRELREYCKLRGWKIYDEYSDRVPGARESRPELDKLMADARRRRFDVVAVWKFDRFCRSVAHLLRSLETFSALGIEFVSLSEQIDTTTPGGKMVFTILGAVAELERSLIGERVRAGLRNAKAKGQKLGRPPKKELTELEIKQIKKDRASGRFSLRQLAKKYEASLWAMQRIADGVRVRA